MYEVMQQYLRVGFAYFSAFILLLIELCVRALVLQSLWNWFVMPLGVVALSFLHSLGLILIINLFLPMQLGWHTDLVGIKMQIKYIVIWVAGLIIHLAMGNG